jgi:hypothetical protein
MLSDRRIQGRTVSGREHPGAILPGSTCRESIPILSGLMLLESIQDNWRHSDRALASSGLWTGGVELAPNPLNVTSNADGTHLPVDIAPL